MKRIFLMSAAAAAMIFASCSKEGGDGTKPTPGAEFGYFAVRVDLESQTRASTEQSAVGDESDLNSIYLVTFNAAGDIVANPDGGFYIALTTEQLAKAEAGTVFTSKVSGDARKIMAVANPGIKLLGALNGLNTGSSYGLFNAAIESITITEVSNATTGFAMISCPSDAELGVNDFIEDALVDITPFVVGTTYTTEQAAIDAAEDAPVTISIERLASKIVFKPVPTVAQGLEVLPTGANFSFDSWTVDAVNETYFPFAKKDILSTTHTGTGYKYDFYTEDPNYVDNNPGSPSELYHSGIAHATIDAATKAPVLPWSNHYGWNEDDTYDYLVENTMAATAQRYGNATRIVIRGTYTPPTFTAGADWFQYAGVNYQTLADLKADFDKTTASAELKAACEAFALQMGAADFASLTQTQLDAKDNGGEWAKVPADGFGIRYYQDGLNYWFYEIRHNAAATGTMEYSKYGTVRNNWYNCTLNKVSGAGTPWYPDLRDPGDGDPKPWDPIDDEYGYIGIIITPQPWIVWENGITI